MSAINCLGMEVCKQQHQDEADEVVDVAKEEKPKKDDWMPAVKEVVDVAKEEEKPKKKKRKMDEKKMRRVDEKRLRWLEKKMRRFSEEKKRRRLKESGQGMEVSKLVPHPVGKAEEKKKAKKMTEDDDESADDDEQLDDDSWMCEPRGWSDKADLKPWYCYVDKKPKIFEHLSDECFKLRQERGYSCCSGAVFADDDDNRVVGWDFESIRTPVKPVSDEEKLDG